MYNNNNVSIKKYNYYLYIVFYCVMTFTITINVTNADIVFPAHVSNDMVLNHDNPVIPGYGDADTVITVSVNGWEYPSRKTIVSDCHQSGYLTQCPFKIILPPMEPSYRENTIEIFENGKRKHKFERILFGKVFLCSGQSNMEFSVNQLVNAEEEIEDSSNYPHMRLFQIPPTYYSIPQISAKSVYENGWTTSNPKALRGDGNFSYFSAVCYTFGRNLYEKYRNDEMQVPIGLLASAYGGTPLQAWSTPNALQACPYAKDINDGAIQYPATFKSVTYNGMIHPLKNFSFNSIIWYQGEYEGEDNLYQQYKCQFPAMVNDWRKNVFEDLHLPFVFVGLAPGNPGYTLLRNAQKSILGMKNTGYVDAFDLGDLHTPWANHPRRKNDVGKRLALVIHDLLLSEKMPEQQKSSSDNDDIIVTTKPDEELSFERPILKSASMPSLKNNIIRLTFDQSELTINETPTYGDVNFNSTKLPPCKNNQGPFEIKMNGKWEFIDSKIDGGGDGNVITLELQTPIPQVISESNVYISIRYAWADAAFCAIYNKHMIPVSPFRKSVVFKNTIKPKHTFLMVDDHDVLYRSGASRKLKEMTRQPSMNIERARLSEFFIAYSTTHYIDGNFHTWYQCCNTDGETCFVCKSTSADGIDFLSDLQQQYPQSYNNGKYVDDFNNIVLPGGGGRYGASVLYDTDDKNTSRKYKMASWAMYPTKKYKSRPGMYVHFSNDGIHWERYDEGGPPQLQGSYSDPTLGQPPFADEDNDNKPTPSGGWLSELSESDVINVFKDERTGEYVNYHKTWIDNNDGTMFWKRAIARSTSKDFIHWDKKRKLVAWPDDRDDISTSFLPKGGQSVELHGGPGFYHKASGLYIMFLQHLDWTDSTLPGILEVELAVSHNNGSKFDRVFRKVDGFPLFLSVNEKRGEFDSGSIWMDTWGHTFYGEDDANDILTTKYLYGAYASWNMEPGADLSGMGTATMEYDRYSYFTPTNAQYGGQVTLKPYLFQNVSNIIVNCDGGSTGSVLVEMLDEYGYRLKGFQKSLFNAIKSNKGNAIATWESASIANDLKQPKLYSIRIHLLGNAKVYAVSLV